MSVSPPINQKSVVMKQSAFANNEVAIIQNSCGDVFVKFVVDMKWFSLKQVNEFKSIEKFKIFNTNNL